MGGGRPGCQADVPLPKTPGARRLLFHENRKGRGNAAVALRDAAHAGLPISQAFEHIQRSLIIKGKPEDSMRNTLMAIMSSTKNGEDTSQVLTSVAACLTSQKQVMREAFLTLRAMGEAGIELSPAEEHIRGVLSEKDHDQHDEQRLLSLLDRIDEVRLGKVMEAVHRNNERKLADIIISEKKHGGKKPTTRHLKKLLEEPGYVLNITRAFGLVYQDTKDEGASKVLNTLRTMQGRRAGTCPLIQGAEAIKPLSRQKA